MKSKRRESPLDNLYLASPCSISWESMIGDERERSCGGCSKAVYNISDMTRKEAERFLLEHGTSECMKFYRRADGTIMTDDCPRALRKVRDRCKFAIKIAAGVVAFMVSLPAALAQSIQTGDTSVVKDSLQKINVPVEPRALPGEAVMLGAPPVSRVIPPPDDTTTNTSKKPSTASVQARIVTKKHTLPNGKKVVLIAPDGDGKVIRTKCSKSLKAQQNPNPNQFLDSRASESYAAAQKAKSENKFDLAEFHFEKALEMYDLQKGGDPGFRKHIENELKSVQSRKSVENEKTAK